MPMVWTASQGTIQRPSPGARPLRGSSPRRRFSLVSAISAAEATSPPFVRFRTSSLTVAKLLIFPLFAGRGNGPRTGAMVS